jgi:hypothetical protein
MVDFIIEHVRPVLLAQRDTSVGQKRKKPYKGNRRKGVQF